MTDKFVTPEIPESPNNYMAFKQGDNKIRILDNPLAGSVYWEKKDGKNVVNRVKIGDHIDDDIMARTGREKVKYFWIFPAWNYAEERLQILELTQKTIIRAIEELTTDEAWGDPRDFDIVVNKKGEGLETEYPTRPQPKTENKPATEALEKLKKEGFNLEKIYAGENPFGKKTEREEEKTEEASAEEGEVDVSEVFPEE